MIAAKHFVTEEEGKQQQQERPRGGKHRAARIEDEKAAPQSTERKLGGRRKPSAQPEAPLGLRLCHGRRHRKIAGRELSRRSGGAVFSSLQPVRERNGEHRDGQIGGKNQMRARMIDAPEGEVVHGIADHHRRAQMRDDF